MQKLVRLFHPQIQRMRPTDLLYTILKIKKTALVLEHQSGRENRLAQKGVVAQSIPLAIIPLLSGFVKLRFKRGCFFEMSKMRPRAAGRKRLLLLVRRKAAAAKAESAQTRERHGHRLQAAGPPEAPVGGRAQQGSHRGYYETKTAALEALGRLSGRSINERYNMTFAEVFKEWKAEHYKEIGPKGISSYDRAFDVFQSLHGKKFRDLRTVDFQGVLDDHLPAFVRFFRGALKGIQTSGLPVGR